MSESLIKEKQEDFIELLGIDKVKISKGVSQAEVSIKDKFIDDDQKIAPGIIFTLADSIAGINSIATCGNKMATVESNINYFSIKDCYGKKIFAKAKLIRNHEIFKVSDVVVKNDVGKVIAEGTFTFSNLFMKYKNFPYKIDD
jgi:uncharacterized protein (TIGR00369 family)